MEVSVIDGRAGVITGHSGVQNGWYEMISNYKRKCDDKLPELKWLMMNIGQCNSEYGSNQPILTICSWLIEFDIG